MLKLTKTVQNLYSSKIPLRGKFMHETNKIVIRASFPSLYSIRDRI